MKFNIPYSFGHMTCGKFIIWKKSRLLELRHQMTGYCPSIRIHRLTVLPFTNLVIEHTPSAWRDVYSHPMGKLMERVCSVTERFLHHFGLEGEF